MSGLILLACLLAQSPIMVSTSEKSDLPTSGAPIADTPIADAPLSEPAISEPVAAGSVAAEPDASETVPAAAAPDKPLRPARLPLPTLGGSQFWGDVRLRGGWRIQRQVFTGSHRLIDPTNRQHTTGTLQQCLDLLDCDECRVQNPPMTGEVTLLLHGILRGSSSMFRIEKRLRAAGLQPLRVDYPSTQGTISDGARCLIEAVAHLDPGVTRVNLVVHSMGGLVVREFGRLVSEGLADGSLDASYGPAAQDRLGRLVMIATPNHGAEMATHLKNFAPFQAIYGPAGRQLAHDEQWLADLPTPPCEFGIIAGHRGSPGGFNPFIPGDDDGTVTVASARLAGASDFLAVKGTHSFLLLQSNVAAACERYLKTGAFRETGQREPIP